MTKISLEDDIRWDGNKLAVWATAGETRILCQIPRDTIHTIPMFNDVLTREIARDRTEIVERLRLVIFAKVERAKGGIVLVEPADLQTTGRRS